MYKKTTPGPTAYFDVDDTLIMWKIPEGAKATDIVTVNCRGVKSQAYINRYNLELLHTMAQRGHSIVVWSAGGSDWAEAAVIALELQEVVDVVATKPTYYIDDIKDPAKVLGKHGYFDINGKRYDTHHRDHVLDPAEEANGFTHGE